LPGQTSLILGCQEGILPQDFHWRLNPTRLGDARCGEIVEPFRFVHTADLHLDSPFRGLAEVSPELQPTLRDATFQAFEGVVDLCLARQVDGLLIAGDVYDAADRSLRALARLRHQFERLAERGISVFVCHGNHDPLSGWGARFTWPDNVHVFGAAGVEARPLIRSGVEVARIYGISYGAERVTDNLALLFRRDPRAPFAIGLLHTNVGNDPNHLNYAPCLLADLVRAGGGLAGMDYWALGHVHAHRVLHVSGPTVIYPGNPQGRHPREAGPRGCYLVEVNDRAEVRYEFVPLDVVRWHTETLPIEGLQQLEELLARFEARMEDLRREAADRGNIVRWRLEGRGPLHRELIRPGRTEDLLATLREQAGAGPAFVWSESLQDTTGRDLDLDLLRQEENLLGDFLRLAGQADEQRLEEIRTVLSPLFEDPRTRRYLTAPDSDTLQGWLRASEQLGVDRLLTGDE
jgi:exonuclease SbcD